MQNGVYAKNQWTQGTGPIFENTCPATGEVVWQGHAASREQVFDVANSASKAFETWSIASQQDRNDVLRAYAAALDIRKEAIATAISRDMGKPFWESLTEAGAMVAKIEISIKAMEERAGHKESSTDFGGMRLRHRAHGVMAVFGPFNFPGHLPNGHIVPALLAGNTCIFKPSEQAPSVAGIIAEAFEEAGLPANCLNIVQGGRDTGAALLDADINGVLFTGSATTGTAFHRHFAGRPDVILALEMGGNSPLIVDGPTDIDTAADTIFQSAFISSGQRCSCARRLVVTDSIDQEALISALQQRIENVAIGFWNEENVFIGPLVSPHAARAAIEFEQRLIKNGGVSLKRLEMSDRSQALLRPGLVDVTGIAEREDEELFGPLLQIIRVSDSDAALREANASRFGLAAGVVTDDDDLWNFYADRLRAGILNRNRATAGAASSMPFGGPGLSGNYRPSAYYAADYCAWPQASQIAETTAPFSAPGYPSTR